MLQIFHMHPIALVYPYIYDILLYELQLINTKV